MSQCLRVAVVTVLPELFEPFCRLGVTGRAIQSGLVGLKLVNPRAYSEDRHRRIDDRPYGGGPGMVMLGKPLRAAIRAAGDELGGQAHRVYLSPQGARLDQSKLRSLQARSRAGLVLVCGRYEGVDERLVEADIDEEISVGDYVLSGGEVAAMALVDGLARLIPGALGHAESAVQDSFEGGLLDCPHYSRPEVLDGVSVPPVLLSGDHAAIRRWRLKQSLGRTWRRRPDLLRDLQLDPEQASLLAEYRKEMQGGPRCGPNDGTEVED